MAKYSDDELAVAMVYAKAMFELATEQGQVDALREELSSVATMIEGNRDFAAFLGSPTVDVASKRNALEKALRGRCSDLLVDSLQIINRNGRQQFFGSVAEAFRMNDEQHRGVVEVNVRTPVALSDAMRTRICKVISAKTGKTPRIVEIVDESLLGGLIIRIGDEKLDASVARKVTVLTDLLNQRASREIHAGRDYVAA